MPKIATYEPNQVRTQITKQPLAQDAPADAFGGPVAVGLGNLAQAAVQMKKRIDTTSAEEALVRFERDKNDLFFNPKEGYFNTQGRNAYDGSTAATQAMEDLKLKYGETLGSESKAMFDKAANAHITRGNTDIMRHASKGLQTWEIATIESQVENSIENASLYWGNSKLMDVNRINGEQAVLDAAELSGIGAEATAEKLQTFRSAFARSAIDAAIVNSASAGVAAFEKYGDQLEGPDKVKIESMIEKKRKTEKTKADAQVAVLTAVSLNGKYDNLGDIKKEIDEKFKSDPKLHKQVMSEAISRYNIKQKIKTEEQKNNYNTIIDLVNKDKTVAEMKALEPKAWEGMSPLQENNILSGKHIVSDQVLLNDINSMSDKDLAEIDPNTLVGKLTPNDVDKIVKRQAKINKGDGDGFSVRSRATITKGMVKSAYPNKWESSKSGKKTEAGKNADELFKSIQIEVDKFNNENKRDMSHKEYDELLYNMITPVIQERSADFGFVELDMFAEDWELNLENTPAEHLLILNRMVKDSKDIDKGLLIKSYESLIDEGVDINFRSIGTKYNQGK